MKPGEVDFATAGPETKPRTTMTTEQLRAWLGDYRNPENGDIWQVTEREGTLWLDFEGVRRQLRALSSTEFEPLRYVYRIRLKFESAQNATRRKLIVLREMEPYATLEAVGAPTVSTAELAACAGDYWSDELQATYRLALYDGKLWMKDLIGSDRIVHRGTIRSGELHPVFPDEFYLSGGPLIFHFTRDENGNVTGLVLNGITERGILFTRLGK